MPDLFIIIEKALQRFRSQGYHAVRGPDGANFIIVNSPVSDGSVFHGEVVPGQFALFGNMVSEGDFYRHEEIEYERFCDTILA